MPSRRRSGKRPWGAEHPELDVDRVRGGRRVESAGDGEWTVQEVVGEKAYTCPGCRQDVGAGVAHVVAWPNDALLGDGVEHRRHWHRSCWQQRARRR